MLIFKVLSRLLDYPQAEMLTALEEMAAIVGQCPRLSQSCKGSLQALLASYQSIDLLDAQESYVALFDRGRYVSLHLFEHVHGESRDRGQAMVNLLNLYQSQGFELDSRELPDYLPLFLEFLSQVPEEQALAILQDASPVLSLLAARLTERGSQFAAIFDALTELAGDPEGMATVRQLVANETADETLTDIDAIWEEEAVSFMASSSGDCRQSADSPVKITPRQQFAERRNHSLHEG